MNRSRTLSPTMVSAAVVVAIAAVALVVSGVLGRAQPTAPPTASKPPSASPTAKPTPSPKPSPDFAAGVRVPLRTATGETKAVYIGDSTGMLVDAVSGRPREDVSVGPRRVVVEQVDSRTLRVIWADTAINEDVSLALSRAGGTLKITMIRRHMSPDIEIAHERVVLLTFESGVNAAGVEATIKNSLDPGD